MKSHSNSKSIDVKINNSLSSQQLRGLVNSHLGKEATSVADKPFSTEFLDIDKGLNCL